MDLSGADIAGDVRIQIPIEVDRSNVGGIIARRARILGRFDLSAIEKLGAFSEEATGRRVSLRATDATLGHLVVGSADRLAGGLDLSGAEIQHLETVAGDGNSATPWPVLASTSAWNVQRTSGPVSDGWSAAKCFLWRADRSAGASSNQSENWWRYAVERVREAVDWIRIGWSHRGRYGNSFSIQPWMAIADTFDRAGRESDGRRLRFEATDLLLRHRSHVLSRNVWRVITKYTIGHGYYAQIALVWLIGLWALATLLVFLNQGAFTPVSVSSTFPPLIGPLFAIDVVLSPVGTGQSDTWMATQDTPLIATLTLIKLASWAMLGMFVTGVSGILTRR